MVSSDKLNCHMGVIVHNCSMS